LREATGGPVVEAERADIERALERVGDHAVREAAFVAGGTDPQAAVAAARATRRS
jgi:hypothetical protein